MKQVLIAKILSAVKSCGIENASIKLDYPEVAEYGDFSTNVALSHAKTLKMSPKALAEKIVIEIRRDMPKFLKDVSVAGAGFINFFVKEKAFASEVVKMLAKGSAIGKNSGDEGQEVMVEYTDPNTFKVFHIGHLMSNSIGESISRLIEFSGAKVVRICYPSDIGLHIAKAIWAVGRDIQSMPPDSATIEEKTDYLGKKYVEGSKSYESDETAKKEIDALNEVIYNRTDKGVSAIFDKGRSWSLEHFDELYTLLGTRFDETIFESEMAPVGLDIVKKFLKQGVFEISDGATVFKGEEYGLHTRVFINSKGLPTYEAKDVGLNVTKFKKHPKASQSIIITASEQNDYFRVLTKVLSLIDEKDGSKTKHIGHGMMRFADSKMSSRTGNVVTADSLISDVKDLVKGKIVNRGFGEEEAEDICNKIAVGAIKYTILRQSIGGDIVFDSASSISFEGDSGPYLQYAAVRARSILQKAKDEGVSDLADKTSVDSNSVTLPEKVSAVERLLVRFGDVVEKSRSEYAPQHVANYLVALAGAYNSFYASQVIVSKEDKVSPYYVYLTKVFLNVMENGLWLLGISIPPKM